jgi:hypothetical protein
MACLRCGKIQDLESELFDRLKGQVERECRFHIMISRFEIGGYCAQCRTTGIASGNASTNTASRFRKGDVGSTERSAVARATK